MTTELQKALAAATGQEVALVIDIVNRAFGAMYSIGAKITGYDRMAMQMDLLLCNHHCPLLLREMLNSQARDEDVLHDVFGIARHLDRETGKLKDCFLPRFADPEAFQR